MAASYPASIKSFTTKTNLVDLVDAAHVNDLQLEVTAIETELGTVVRGTSTDLKTRLAVCLAGDGSIVSSPSFLPSPVQNQLFVHSGTDTMYRRKASSWEAVGQSNSNMIFCWAGCYSATSKGLAFFSGTTLSGNTGTGANYYYVGSNAEGADSFKTIFQFKWKKIPGVNTITVRGVIWLETTTSSPQAKLKVSVGTPTVTLTGTANQTTPEEKSGTIDVSGLTNSTVYDVTIQLASSVDDVNNSVLMGHVELEGS